jgi:hypothetical protein
MTSNLKFNPKERERVYNRGKNDFLYFDFAVAPSHLKE